MADTKWNLGPMTRAKTRYMLRVFRDHELPVSASDTGYHNSGFKHFL